METLIPKLITSYSNGNDYHAAIAGVVIGNEFEGYGVAECVKFTRRFVEIERSSFASHRQLPIGHPLSFNAENGKNPCWEKWDSLVPALKPIMGSRLFLAPQTYNPASDLFVGFNGKAGWVDQTYNEYNLPIWFTEIGQDRTKQNYAEIVKDQLEACLKFSQANPNKLLGACFFSYADKVWLPAGHSEASYGAHSHGPKGCTITYTDKDFKIWDTAADGTLNIDSLKQTELYKAVYSAYQAK